MTCADRDRLCRTGTGSRPPEVAPEVNCSDDDETRNSLHCSSDQPCRAAQLETFDEREFSTKTTRVFRVSILENSGLHLQFPRAWRHLKLLSVHVPSFSGTNVRSDQSVFSRAVESVTIDEIQPPMRMQRECKVGSTMIRPMMRDGINPAISECES